MTTDKALDTLDSLIVDAFTDIPEVDGIYRDSRTVFVFTTNTKYDDALMDRMLEKESDILDQYSGRLHFRYIALVLVDKPHQVTSEMLIPILLRE